MTVIDVGCRRKKERKKERNNFRLHVIYKVVLWKYKKEVVQDGGWDYGATWGELICVMATQRMNRVQTKTTAKITTLLRQQPLTLGVLCKGRRGGERRGGRQAGRQEEEEEQRDRMWARESFFPFTIKRYQVGLPGPSTPGDHRHFTITVRITAVVIPVLLLLSEFHWSRGHFSQRKGGKSERRRWWCQVRILLLLLQLGNLFLKRISVFLSQRILPLVSTPLVMADKTGFKPVTRPDFLLFLLLFSFFFFLFFFFFFFFLILGLAQFFFICRFWF